MSLLSCEVKLSAKCLLSMNNINPNNNLLHGLREVVAMLAQVSRCPPSLSSFNLLQRAEGHFRV